MAHNFAKQSVVRYMLCRRYRGKVIHTTLYGDFRRFAPFPAYRHHPSFYGDHIREDWR